MQKRKTLWSAHIPEIYGTLRITDSVLIPSMSRAFSALGTFRCLLTDTPKAADATKLKEKSAAASSRNLH